MTSDKSTKLVMKIKFSLIGGGVMGEALLSRLISGGVYQPQEVIVSELLPSRQSYLKQKYQVTVTSDNHWAFTEAQEVVLLAVKPQVFSTIAQELAEVSKINNHYGCSGGIDNNGYNQSQPLLVSVLAGVSLRQLKGVFPYLPIIRVMTNTPALIGAGMTAICFGDYTKSKDQEFAKKLFATVGEVVEISESLIDAVTGLSGSGPAYVALMLEALADGGVAAGLPRGIANQLALQTVLGTALLLNESKIHPAVLKDQVTSPGGTTIAGIAHLEKAAFRSALIEAVMAAKIRSEELGK
ncbi:Pyrroline-5-carboxylate reductase [Richelia intracellularis HH01]|uniref:Pyrroline-5-carboxylate reductase n=2 Tax=Richelia TaxID=98443 RepID=M1X394_9NOST|nr:Pyrroline-5-carboxylate reductase [Richelia intracellularis HH01]